MIAAIATRWPGDRLALALKKDQRPFEDITEGMRALAIKEISFAATDVPVITDQPEDAVAPQAVFDNSCRPYVDRDLIVSSSWRATTRTSLWRETPNRSSARKSPRGLSSTGRSAARHWNSSREARRHSNFVIADIGVDRSGDREGTAGRHNSWQSTAMSRARKSGS